MTIVFFLCILSTEISIPFGKGTIFESTVYIKVICQINLNKHVDFFKINDHLSASFKTSPLIYTIALQ